MIKKDIIDRLKAYKIRPIDNLEDIAESFPLIFGNLLQLLMIKVHSGHVMNLIFPPKTFRKFTEDLEQAIKNNNFDNFDNIVLELLSSYHYRLPSYIITIDFNEEIKNKFIQTCNEFKGKDWNSILDVFIEGIYELLSTSSIVGGDLHLGTNTWR